MLVVIFMLTIGLVLPNGKERSFEKVLKTHGERRGKLGVGEGQSTKSIECNLNTDTTTFC